MDMRIGEAALGSPDTGYTLIPIPQGETTIDHLRELIKVGEWTLCWNHKTQLVATKKGPYSYGDSGPIHQRPRGVQNKDERSSTAEYKLGVLRSRI